MLEISRVENINYLKFIAHKYRSEGWSVFSGILGRYEKIPQGWTGPEPNVLFIKKRRAVAVCIETLSSLKDEIITDKWNEIINEKRVQDIRHAGSFVRLRVKLLILTSDKKTLEIAKKIAKTHSISVDLQIIRKVVRKKRSKKSFSLNEKSKLDKLMVVVGVIVIVNVCTGLVSTPPFAVPPLSLR